MIFRQDAPSRYPSLSPRRYLARSALPRKRFRSLARCGCHGRRPWRPVIEVLRASRLPLIAMVTASIRRMHSGCAPWRPVLKQVLPCRSRSSAAEIDPQPSFAKALGCKSRGDNSWLGVNPSGSFQLNAQLLDDRPPFLCIGLHKCAEYLRCLLLARENYPRSAIRDRTALSARASTAAALSLPMMSLGVPLGTKSPAQA
jgi:hypothetical protein